MWRETFYIFIINFSPQGREMLNIVVRKKPLVKKEMTMILRFIKKTDHHLLLFILSSNLNYNDYISADRLQGASKNLLANFCILPSFCLVPYFHVNCYR